MIRLFLALIFVLTLGKKESLLASGVKQIATGAATVGVYNALANKEAESKFSKMCPTQTWACALAVAAATGVVASVLTAKKSRASENAANCQTTNTCVTPGGGGGPGTTTSNPYNRLDPNSPIDSEILRLEREDLPSSRQLIKNMRSKGYEVDTKNNSVKTPDGKKVSASSLSSSGIASAGISPADLLTAEDVLKDSADSANKKLAKLKEMDEEYSGGRGLKQANGYESNTTVRPGINPFALSQPRRPNGQDSSVAGLSINHGGDSIGVSADNLFKMIERAYDSQAPFMASP